MAQNHPNTISSDDISKILEPLIRRVVREELERIAQKQPEIFFLTPDMPLYSDMKDIKKRKAKDGLKFYSQEEVWGE